MFTKFMTLIGKQLDRAIVVEDEKMAITRAKIDANRVHRNNTVLERTPFIPAPVFDNEAELQARVYDASMRAQRREREGKVPSNYANGTMFTQAIHASILKNSTLTGRKSATNPDLFAEDIFFEEFDDDIPLVYVKCYKCKGSGHLPEYQHVEKGVCFNCNGTGKL